MVNSKRHKLVCCLMAMALLLSFFYVVPDPAGKAERGNVSEVVWVMLLVCVVCRILSRRYGCRMIYHWENIYYIHQTDGKKGDCLLNYLHI